MIAESKTAEPGVVNRVAWALARSRYGIEELAFSAMVRTSTREFLEADARAAIEAMPSVWQPMDTAPKDGTEILLLFEDGRRRIAAWKTTCHPLYKMAWKDYPGSVLVRGWKNDPEPIRWMRLPAALDGRP